MQTTGREQITVAVCMYVGYLMLTFCRTAFTTVSPALVEDPGLSLTTTDIGDILGYAALGSLVGKLLTGFVADRFGGRLTLLLALGVVASLTLAMGYLASFFAFALFIFCLSLVRAGGWPALTKLIGQWIPPANYGRTWGILSTGSRAGAVISSLVLGLLLIYALGEVSPDTLVVQDPGGWRWVPVTSGVLGLAGCARAVVGVPEAVRVSTVQSCRAQAVGTSRDPALLRQSPTVLVDLRERHVHHHAHGAGQFYWALPGADLRDFSRQGCDRSHGISIRLPDSRVVCGLHLRPPDPRAAHLFYGSEPGTRVSVYRWADLDHRGPLRLEPPFQRGPVTDTPRRGLCRPGLLPANERVLG